MLKEKKRKESCTFSHNLRVKFEIRANAVKLEMDKSYPELEDLCNDFHTPENILNEMSKRGIHLLPTEDDYNVCGIPRKDPEAEKNAIRDISYAVESFYIRNKPNDS